MHQLSTNSTESLSAVLHIAAYKYYGFFTAVDCKIAPITNCVRVESLLGFSITSTSVNLEKKMDCSLYIVCLIIIIIIIYSFKIHETARVNHIIARDHHCISIIVLKALAITSLQRLSYRGVPASL